MMPMTAKLAMDERLQSAFENQCLLTSAATFMMGA